MTASGPWKLRAHAGMNKLDEMSSKITSALSQVSELQIKPARRWEGLADKAIWAVFAAVIAFLLAKIGL